MSQHHLTSLEVGSVPNTDVISHPIT